MRDMLGRGEAVSVEEALRLILNGLPGTLPQGTAVGLEDSCRRVLSREIVSPEDLPGFARSTMDGYAVAAADTFGAGEGGPAYLDVTREISMGEEPGFRLGRGEAARIATGGMLPEGADAVLMLEHAQVLDRGVIEAQKAVAPGDNVIQKGEDIGKGEVVLGRGRRLRPQDVAALAGIGLTEAPVYERPGVAIISTGDEVVPAGAALKPGLIRDMNSHALACLVREEGCVPNRRGILRDDHGLIRDAVESSAADSAAVLISGGSSVGARDMTERAVNDLGRVLFHGVSLKPGKPLLYGVVGGKPVFGLPGHPRAVFVCFELFVRPVLRSLAGVSERGNWEGGKTVTARLSVSIHSAPGRRESINVRLEDVGGELLAVPLPGKSGLITMLVRADGTVSVPPESTGYQSGQTVEVAVL